ncbi:MAG: hypothetical protein JW904_04720 [Spirochaetales bacterium]|nr:hypothetical protein [Spirochaetales bacterium]
MPFIGVDVSRDLHPLDYIHSLKEAGIACFGAEKVFWNDIEPASASGYRWTVYDDAVKKIEAAGGDILPTIWCVSSWATEKPSIGNPSSMPQNKFRQRYYDFIRAFVERYDGDGISDMPGLKRGHHYLQIEDEAQNLGDSWIASQALDIYKSDSMQYYRYAAKEYGEMLRSAYSAAHTANPHSKIISFSFNFGDYFNRNPSEVFETNPRMAFLNEIMINYNRYFDIIGVQANYSYTGIPVMIQYLRSRYALQKPVLCADAASMPMIGQYQFEKPDQYEEIYPYLKDKTILAILDKGPEHPRYAEIKLWWEKEKAILCVKKAVIAAGAGAEQISFQFMQTWRGSGSAWLHSDLLSSGPQMGDAEPEGTPRPAVFALGQLIRKVDNFVTIENMNPLPPGEDPYSWNWIYRWKNNGKYSYIAWNETIKNTIDFRSLVSSEQVTLTPIITKMDSDNNPEMQEPFYRNTAAIPIGSIPVYIEVK